MQVAELEVHNKSGLHARPAATFVKTAAGFRSKVTIENLTRGTNPANAKSLLAVLGCGVDHGAWTKRAPATTARPKMRRTRRWSLRAGSWRR